MMRGIFWFDPGVSTGVAWGVFNLKSKLVIDAMKDRLNSGSTTIKTDGYQMSHAIEQAQKLWIEWRRFKRQCIVEGRMDPDSVIIGAENFVLTPVRHTPGIEGIFPTYVLGAFEGYRHGLFDSSRAFGRSHRHISPLVLQMAAKGKKYDNQNHLKKWDAWIVGKEHERTAFAHIGAYLMDHLR